MTSDNSTIWSAPANIALVKYWGKHGDQLPQNPSISITLSESITTTRIEWTKALATPEHKFQFENREEPVFEKKVMTYLNKVGPLLPELTGYSLNISSRNNFPHSSGISSSASFMASMALCLIRAEEKISGVTLPADDFYRKASNLARLGSGSAARSVYSGYTLWGKTGAIQDSSDDFAVQINDQVHPVFKTYRDAILVVSSQPKMLSSTAGHGLMQSNPYAETRYEVARKNINLLLSTLKSGDQESFIRIIEEEALTLHGLILSSSGGPILLEPASISIIRLIRDYRIQTGSKLCFTLDAGPNIHLLYPESESAQIMNFIGHSLAGYCENQRWIPDLIGEGSKELIGF
jgi:diphosphomevalonate decarboxylase